MYRNLSKGEYGCHSCQKSAKEIIKLIEQRKRVVIAFNPEEKLIHATELHKGHPVTTVGNVFMSYHISNVTDKCSIK